MLTLALVIRLCASSHSVTFSARPTSAEHAARIVQFAILHKRDEVPPIQRIKQGTRQSRGE